MARIRGRNTGPEIALARELWSHGARYRKHAKTPVGRPDFVFSRLKVAVFVDGCQWHGCPDHYVRPRTRNDFWGKKLSGNVLRDSRQTLELERMGWRVVRVWEHELKQEPESVVQRVLAVLEGAPASRTWSWRTLEVDVVDSVEDTERRHFIELRNPSRRREVVRKRSTKKW
jgi:DNA mismatch endonuclease (patch repair protein)